MDQWLTSDKMCYFFLRLNYYVIGVSCDLGVFVMEYLSFPFLFLFFGCLVWNDYFGLAAAIEKDLWATGTVNEEYLKALNSLFSNFPRLRATEPATLSIPHLVTSLKTGSEATQEAALDALFLLRQAWSACPAEVSRAQSIAAADAIPLLQYLIQSGPPRFQEKAEFLLQCLPGTLVVIIKRGNNMKQSVGNPSVFCKLTLGNTPPRQTKVTYFYILSYNDILVNIFFLGCLLLKT